MPLNNPVAGDIHVNKPLTNFAQKYLQGADMFVAGAAMPNAPVQFQSDLYYEYNKGDFFRDEAEERADGTETAGSGFDVSTSTYLARVYGYHKDVSDRQRRNSDPQINLDESATQFVTLKMLIKREVLFAAQFMDSSNWTTTLNVDWSSASSDPIANVRTAKRTIQGLTGLRPNKMLLGRQAWDTLMDNDALLSRITGGANNAQPAMVQRQLVAQLLELDNIYVMDSIKNTAVKGATDSLSFIGGDSALIYYAPNTVSLNEPSAGVGFSWTGYLGATQNGQRIKRFRMENIGSDRIEGEIAVDFKVTAADLGYMFTTVSAA